MAIANPLLDIDVKGAKGVLFNFSGGPDLTLGEVNDAANIIAREVDPSAIMFFGMSTPCEEMRNSVKLTLLATGIDPALPSNWLSEMKADVRTFFSGKKSSW
jgi:cell division protein FtsZ